MISDKGSQFYCHEYKKWAKRRKINLRYGAVGKYGSIAVIERFILSLKSEFTNRLLIPFSMDGFRNELSHYLDWYNGLRPHQNRSGHTPDEVYMNIQPQAPPHHAETRDASWYTLPNTKLPVMKLTVSHLHGNRLLPVVELRKAA